MHYRSLATEEARFVVTRGRVGAAALAPLFPLLAGETQSGGASGGAARRSS